MRDDRGMIFLCRRGMPSITVWGNTYGTWLPGDPRGFRTRWHREHIEGDYRNPPPKGKYDKRHQKAQSLLKRAPVILSREHRPFARNEFLRSFQKWSVEVVALSVGAVHFHVLARFPDHKPRHWIGLAKKESSAYLKQSGHAPQGGLWAVKCECLPITDREHQIRVFWYILNHEKQGASVWRIPRQRPDQDFLDPDGLLLE